MAIANPIAWYTRWLHTQWPAGKPERLPIVNDDGSTNVTGLYVVGDLSGIPLLKLSVNAGVRVVREIADQLDGSDSDNDDVLDVAICGGGTAGFAAAKECEKLGLRYMVFEASTPFSTIVNFPKEKPIYKYPTEMDLEGELEFHDKSDVKEGLIEDLREQTVDQGLRFAIAKVDHVERKSGLLELVIPDGVSFDDAQPGDGVDFLDGAERVKARRVIVAIGRSGNYRKLGVPGEELDKVYNRLHDPKDYCGQDVLIVGGGDSAMETAIALTMCGADVTLSYRRQEFNRPKPENLEKLTALAENPDARAEVEEASDHRMSASTGDWMDSQGQRGTLRLVMPTNVTEIRDGEVDIAWAEDGADHQKDDSETIDNESVFAMIGREPPLDFFRKSGVRILGERTAWWWISLIAFLIFCWWMYHWKASAGFFDIEALTLPQWLVWEPAATWAWIVDRLGPVSGYFQRDGTFGNVLITSMSSKSFYYTLAYASAVVIFGIRRIRRRKTPYITWQTLTLMTIQVLPLFLLPELILPYLDAKGAMAGGVGGWIKQEFFPGGSWWRAYGLILAWPLMAWNWFTAEPIWGWLILGFLQTFVAIPAMIYFWGKGAYCGWICSCGALAETLGDTHRHKMPHGPIWNRVNMVGQALLLFAVVLMGLRIVGWVTQADRSDTQAYVSQPDQQPDNLSAEAVLYNVAATDLAEATGVTGPDGRPLTITSIQPIQGAVAVRFDQDIRDIANDNINLTWSSGTHAATAGLFTWLANDAPLISWAWFVDLLWAGVIGVGLYFWFSGRVWCRFACPLAALMHIYHRFSRFRILADKKKCISCNVCTSVCHQGIDVMSFANKGRPMADPQCVRCSACVQSCPTGVLYFGQVDGDGNEIHVDPDWLAASPVRMREVRLTVNGK
jgi:thioredoxin reductase/ferredoxin